MTANAIDFRSFFLALIADIANDPGYICGFDCPHEEFHRFFWQLNRNTKTQFLVEDLMFDTNGTYPYSEKIDELFQEFHLAGILEWTHPLGTKRHQTITVTDWLPSVEFEDKITPGKWSEYQRAIAQFKQQFCTPV